MRDLSSWIDFFAAAGVPPMVRKTYAQIFVDHRITDAVVADLEKEHLRDMGIVVVGDIIAILKQCKKVGHEDPTATVPSVSSTTPNPEKLHAVHSVGRHRGNPITTVKTNSQAKYVPPEQEGKYIVKMPAGTTAKTRRILAAIKQRDAANVAARYKSAPVTNMIAIGRQKATTNSTTSFGDSDESDGYHVILSKHREEHQSNTGSVFNRLGSATSAMPVSNSLSPAAQRLIKRSIPVTRSVPEKVVSSTGVSIPDGRTVNQHETPWRFSDSDSLLITRPGMKRPAKASVFGRLSEPIVQRSPVSGALDYAGVLKRPRPQSNSQANPTRPPVLVYSEGVLSSSSQLTQKVVGRSSVKNRLGRRSIH